MYHKSWILDPKVGNRYRQESDSEGRRIWDLALPTSFRYPARPPPSRPELWVKYTHFKCPFFILFPLIMFIIIKLLIISL